MATVQIDTLQNHPSYEQETELDGAIYRLLFRWNEREEKWYLTIKTVDGDVILSTKIVSNWPLLRTLVHPSRPPGELVAVDVSGELGTDAGLTELGGRVLLLYYEGADINPPTVGTVELVE